MAEQPRNQFEAFSQWLSENPILAGVVGLAVIMVFLPVKKADFAGRFNPVQRHNIPSPQSKAVKLYTKGESFWGLQASPDTAYVDNLIMKYRLEDLVRYDPETHEVIRLVRRGGFGPTRMVKYQGSYRQAKKFWEDKGYAVEGAVEGLLLIAKGRKRVVRFRRAVLS